MPSSWRAPLRNRTVDLLLTTPSGFVQWHLVGSDYGRSAEYLGLGTSRCVRRCLESLSSLGLSLAFRIAGRSAVHRRARVVNGLWTQETLEVVKVLPGHLQRAVRRGGERSGAFRVGEHVDGVLGELVGYRFGGMVGSRVEPPGNPVAHADDRQCGQPLVPGAELSPRLAFLDDRPQLGEDLPARLEVQGGYFFRERGLGAVEDPEAFRCCCALEYQFTDHGPQFLDRAEVGAEPGCADEVRGVLADVLDELGEQLFFAADVVVEPGPGDPDGIGDVLQRGPVVSALGEEPGGVLEDLRHHQLAS